MRQSHLTTKLQLVAVIIIIIIIIIIYYATIKAAHDNQWQWENKHNQNLKKIQMEYG